MNLTELGGRPSPNDLGAARGAKGKALTSYDSLAGSSMLRRAGKADPTDGLRGDQASRLLAARRREVATDPLGRQLAEFYQEILRQPVPARILDLVEALDAQHSR